MPPPAANWRGYLKLSLVSCPIVIYPASSSSERITFNTLNRKTGNRVKSVYVDPVTGEDVPAENQVKGYAVAKNQYVFVEDDELDGLKIESSHTIDIEKFVPRSEIDQRYYDVPYYIVPDGKVAQEAFAVIRDAMRDSERVGLGRVVITRRERVVMLEAFEQGLLGTMLRYDYEVRDIKAYFDPIPAIELQPELTALATNVIRSKLAHFDPADFTDRYQEALADLVKRKQGEAAPKPAATEAPASNVVDLMEALRRSMGGALKADAPAKGAAKSKEKAPAKKPGKPGEAKK